jgi:1-acyl-sn-glycerol-3-phosphate acyltransferase
MFRKFVIFFVMIFLDIYFKIDVVNCDRFEKIKSGCIVAPNHISAWETVIIPAKTKRVMWMMGKEELFKNKVGAFFLNALKVFPIARGKKDFMSIKKAATLASNGNAVCVFPQGTRKKFGAKLAFKPGATMVAYKAKVPVIPVSVVPENDFKFRSKVHIVYGEPIYFYDYYDTRLSKEVMNKLTEQIEKAVQKGIDSVKGE